MKAKSRFSFNALLSALVFAASPAFAGSLWKDGVTDERGMFADKRARRVGDIVTIVVQETATLSNSARLKTDKDSKAGVEGLASNVINSFLNNLPTKVFSKQIAERTPKDVNITIPSTPSLPVSGSNEYTGGGEIKNTQTIATRAAVQIIDVLPNGNLVFEGIRQISFSKERQFASLRGVIRPYDIQQDNTVISSNVADARIDIVAEGVLTDAQKKGWLLRLNDKINPF
jgi:flagellar L-ring protein precursor FlgH